jgi:hypothetical protein
MYYLIWLLMMATAAGANDSGALFYAEVLL